MVQTRRTSARLAASSTKASVLSTTKSNRKKVASSPSSVSTSRSKHKTKTTTSQVVGCASSTIPTTNNRRCLPPRSKSSANSNASTSSSTTSSHPALPSSSAVSRLPPRNPSFASSKSNCPKTSSPSKATMFSSNNRMDILANAVDDDDTKSHQFFKGVNFDKCSDLLSIPDPPSPSSIEKKRHASSTRRRRQSSPIFPSNHSTQQISGSNHTSRNTHSRPHHYPLVDRTNQLQSSQATPDVVKKKNQRHQQVQHKTKEMSNQKKDSIIPPSSIPALNDDISKSGSHLRHASKKARRSLCHVPSPLLNDTSINSSTRKSSTSALLGPSPASSNVTRNHIATTADTPTVEPSPTVTESRFTFLDDMSPAVNSSTVLSADSPATDSKLLFLDNLSPSSSPETEAPMVSKKTREKRMSLIPPPCPLELEEDVANTNEYFSGHTSSAAINSSDKETSNSKQRRRKRQSILLPSDVNLNDAMDIDEDEQEEETKRFHQFQSNNNHELRNAGAQHSKIDPPGHQLSQHQKPSPPMVKIKSSTSMAPSPIATKTDKDNKRPYNTNITSNTSWTTSSSKHTNFADVRKLVRNYCSLEPDERQDTHHAHEIKSLTGYVLAAPVHRVPPPSPGTTRASRRMTLQRIGPVMEKMEKRRNYDTKNLEQMTGCRCEKSAKSGKYRYYDIRSNRKVRSDYYQECYMSILNTQKYQRYQIWKQRLEKIVEEEEGECRKEAKVFKIKISSNPKESNMMKQNQNQHHNDDMEIDDSESSSPASHDDNMANSNNSNSSAASTTNQCTIISSSQPPSNDKKNTNSTEIATKNNTTMSATTAPRSSSPPKSLHSRPRPGPSLILPFPSRDEMSTDPEIARAEQKLWHSIDMALEEYSAEVVSIMNTRKQQQRQRHIMSNRRRSFSSRLPPARSYSSMSTSASTTSSAMSSSSSSSSASRHLHCRV